MPQWPHTGPPIADIGDLFGVEIDPNAQWDVQWLAAPPLWVTVLLLCVPLACFVYWLYRGSATPASRSRRALLAVTRFLSVLCVILMLFDPVLTVEKEITRRAYVAVLIDDSLSMSFVDRHADPEVRTALARAAGFVGPEDAITATAQMRLEETSRWDLLKAPGSIFASMVLRPAWKISSTRPIRREPFSLSIILICQPVIPRAVVSGRWKPLRGLTASRCGTVETTMSLTKKHSPGGIRCWPKVGPLQPLEAVTPTSVLA